MNDDTQLVQLPQNSLEKPAQDTQFAHESAKMLMDIVRKNNWAKKLGGSSEHLQVEAWLTAGKYYGLSVNTDKTPAEYVEYGDVWGFKAHAEVIDNKSGLVVGGASALCMSDEPNWKNKPKFQLMSMAQTRATSKALRQILSFVVALAGFNPTPAEEMDGVYNSDPRANTEQIKARKAEKDNEEWLNEQSEAMQAHEENHVIQEGHCEECNAEVSDKVKNYSVEKYARVLCYNCQKKV